MSKLVSMLSYRSEIVDCRSLCLEFEFYQLTYQKVQALAKLCFLELSALLKEDFYIDWSWNEKHIQEQMLNANIDSSGKTINFSFNADVLSSVVYNAKSYKAVNRELLFPTQGYNKPFEATNIPNDYKSAFEENFSKNMSEKELKQALLYFFYENNRAMYAYWRKHDAGGSFYSTPYWMHKDLYRGDFTISIAIQSLRSELNYYTSFFMQFARKAADLVTNLSARVCVSPICTGGCSGHMEYFGNNVQLPVMYKNSGLYAVEINPYFYLRGAEWYNILSPLQLERIPDLFCRATRLSNISVRQLSGGGCEVYLNSDILKTDVADFLPIKKLLYNVLYPGYNTMDLKLFWDLTVFSHMTKPRRKWENVAILEEEIDIIENQIIFRHMDNL